jgi:hypothetical protein
MKSLIFITLFVGAGANADYELAENGKTVHCFADDNQDWVISRARTTVKYTVEGESLGARKVIDTNTDGRTYVSYVTDEGTLTLGEKDTYQFSEEDQAWEIECE